MSGNPSKTTLGIPARLALIGLAAGGTAAWLDLWSHRDLLWIWGGVETLGVLVAALLGAALGALVGFLVARPRSIRDLIPSMGVLLVSVGLLVLMGVAAAVLVDRSGKISIPRATESSGVIDRTMPDVFVFLLDALRRDGLYDETGEVSPIAPAMRAFADEAVVFTQARSPAPWTVPSHASLFTGLSSLDHGTTQETPYMDDELTTLAERLSDAGYLTAGLIVNPWISRVRGYGQGFSVYEELWPSRERVPLAVRFAERLGYWQPLDKFQRAKGTGAALKRFEQLLATAPADRPLFVFVNIISAHPLLGAPQPYHDQCMPSQLIESGEPPWRTPQDWTNIYTDATPLDARDLEVLKALYAGEVAYMDAELAETFERLKGHDRFDDALVAITSDHGCGLGEEKHYAAGWDLHERMLQIPMIVRRPGGAGAGTRREDPVQLHDLYPTILEAAGLDGSLPGGERNGVPMFTDEGREASIAAFATPLNMLYSLWLEHPEFDRTPLDRRLLGIIRDDHKLVWNSRDGYSLFDMVSDPAEQTNLYESEALIAQELKERLWWAIDGDPVVLAALLAHWSERARQAGDLDPDTMRSLQSLGYIGGGP